VDNTIEECDYSDQLQNDYLYNSSIVFKYRQQIPAEWIVQRFNHEDCQFSLDQNWESGWSKVNLSKIRVENVEFVRDDYGLIVHEGKGVN